MRERLVTNPLATEEQQDEEMMRNYRKRTEHTVEQASNEISMAVKEAIGRVGTRAAAQIINDATVGVV